MNMYQNQEPFDELVQNWILFYEKSQTANASDDPGSWPEFSACEDFYRISRTKANLALTLIQSVLEQSDNEYVLENLAAGPLEILLSKNGTEIIKSVQELAKKNDRFKWLLAGVWQNSMETNIWERVQIASQDTPEKIPARVFR